jgi:GH15 family glucan-1,4-alpha-glucosidase
MPLPIEDYAMIGDCETAALIGLDGSIDWLCWPRFDSDACFAALLGTPENGRWLLVPQAADVKVTRRYREDTLILETRFETATGSVCVIDFMPPRDHASDLVRIVVGERGEVATYRAGDPLRPWHRGPVGYPHRTGHAARNRRS